MSTPDLENAISYAEKSIGSIYLTGGGFIRREFKGAGTDSRFGWEEMAWMKNPTRALNFAFTNMDDIDVGLVARCEINIKYMNIQDYMDLRKILGRERHFMAEFFDTDSGKWITRDVYCSENTVSKFLTLKQSLIGSIDYAIKLVGTNLDLEDRIGTEASGSEETIRQLRVSFYSGDGTGDTVTQKVSWGDVLTTLPTTQFTAPSGKAFSHWERRVEGTPVGVYGANQKTTIWEDMDLFAVWQ